MLKVGGERRDVSGTPKYLTTINTETGVVTIVGQTETDLDAIAFSSGIPVGGEILPVNKAGVLILWMIPGALLALGIGFSAVRRRYTC